MPDSIIIYYDNIRILSGCVCVCVIKRLAFSHRNRVLKHSGFLDVCLERFFFRTQRRSVWDVCVRCVCER